jgi:hypothetical protein
MMNFTDESVRLILLKNSGYRKCTVYAGNDIHEDRYYTIADGKLFLRHIGKDQGKPYDRIEVCNLDVAKDFLIRAHSSHICRRDRKLKL